MPVPKTPPALAGALDLLNQDWQADLRRLARLLNSGWRRLERRFLAHARARGFDPRQRKALLAVTGGAAARMLAQGRPLADFLEQVDYSGRRLAKLNLPPSAVLEVLARYDQMLEAELDRLTPDSAGGFRLPRQQLSASVAITLNNAFYQVREAETSVFYELGRAELESASQAELRGRCEKILTRYCQAQAGRILVAEGRARLPRALLRPRRLATRECSGELLLEPRWRGRYRAVWSIPLRAPGPIRGLMQFGFAGEYEWLPRELKLLEAAGERCLLASEKARLVEELAAREEHIRKLAGHMLQVEEAERRRIRRELHDEAGQLLLYLRLRLEMLERLAPEELPELRSGLSGARQLIERTIIEIRRLLADLSPALLEQLGLPAALRQLVVRFRRLHSIPTKLHLARLGCLPLRTESVVYRLLQECLNNIARHSSARGVIISLKRDDRALRLRVSDNGVGFDVEEALAKKGCFGLAGVRERVALLGGVCEFRSRPGRGATVLVELPISSQDTAEAESAQQRG